MSPTVTAIELACLRGDSSIANEALRKAIAMVKEVPSRYRRTEAWMLRTTLVNLDTLLKAKAEAGISSSELQNNFLELEEIIGELRRLFRWLKAEEQDRE